MMEYQLISRKKEKITGVMLDLMIYTGAFIIAGIPFVQMDSPLLATAVFTAVATFIVFAASVFLSDVSVYDPYWSVAPPVMILANMLKYRLFHVNAVLLLAVVLIWSFRLTANWFITYKGTGHEDWRYAQYRERYSPFVFQIISFWGLHFVPTIAVFGGMTGAIYAIQQEQFSPYSLAGMVVMLAAVALEHISDWTIHSFLREHKQENRTCNVSVWLYSRHPNYLGEMLFWTGLYLYFAALCPQIWYKGLGFLSIIALFLFVSIPMMEKHNLERRPDYAQYRARTPMLIPIAKRNRSCSSFPDTDEKR